MLAEPNVPLLGGSVLIPYAFTVDGQINKVLDLHNHEPIPVVGQQDFDRRFVLRTRAAIITGGELALEVLDLVYGLRHVRPHLRGAAPGQVEREGCFSSTTSDANRCRLGSP